MIVGLFFHILAAVIWVGGMFFAHQMLRPAVGPLEPAQRLGLWRRVFARFFPVVWLCIAALLASGYAMILWGFGGFAYIGPHIQVMQGIGILMMLAVAHLYFAPWPRFRAAVDGGDFQAAARQLTQIRRIVALNLVLGLIVVVVGATGRYWGV
ncbi:MAG TPA: CopD family protein [Stellaceae bacterium]|nr:CopD family protein [Stellaceae bacterium]